MDFNLDEFLAEQDAISAMPDEDVNVYAQRLANEPSRYAETWKFMHKTLDKSCSRQMNWTDRSYEMVPQIAERDHSVSPGDLHKTVQSQVSSAAKEDAENEVRRWRIPGFLVGLSDSVCA